MSKFEFTKEHFEDVIYATSDGYFEAIAVKANKLLKEHLDKCPKVECHKPIEVWMERIPMHDRATHQAILFNVEEIEETK